jgi:hypothetical protein
VRDFTVSGRLAVKSRIMFYGVDLDIEVARGLLHEYAEPATGLLLPGPCADIYYDRRQPIEWQRLACCKELLHTLDPEQYKITTPERAKRLIEQIALPPGLENIKTDGGDVWGDRLMDIQAVAVLFPMAARNILLKAYQEEKLSSTTIATLARLPERYVRWVMSDQWERLYPQIIEL